MFSPIIPNYGLGKGPEDSNRQMLSSSSSSSSSVPSSLPPDLIYETPASVKDDRLWAEKQAQKQMDFSASQAQKQMDFQLHQSQTQWQRAVDDMRKAGLNPALAYSQGSNSSSTGAMAQGSVANTSSSSQSDELKRFEMMMRKMIQDSVNSTTITKSIVDGVFGMARPQNIITKGR
jgi:hypothetical protein